jgi:hypothetical protein
MTAPAEHVRYEWHHQHRYRVVIGNRGEKHLIHDCRPGHCGHERVKDDAPFTAEELAEIQARGEG